MADTTSGLTPQVASTRHPIYSLFHDEWVLLKDVREGTGGFMDGTYLVAHPREWMDHTQTTINPNGTRTVAVNPNPQLPSPKLKARRALARYENIASALLDAFKASLFRESPTRRLGQDAPLPATPEEEDEEAVPPKKALTAKPPKAPKPAPKHEDPLSPLELWWEDVDGQGTSIDEAMPVWWDLAATFGHVVLLFEPPSDTGGETAADQGLPIIRPYLPLDVLNWLHDDHGNIIAVKLLEAVAPTTFEDVTATIQTRLRVVDLDGWKVYDPKQGTVIAEGAHDFGRLPLVYLYGRRHAVYSDVGQSVLGKPQSYKDIYNLTSELRELLRNQTFSFLNLPLGTGDAAMSVEDAKAMMGQQTGTMNVLFSGPPAQILSADPANVEGYQNEIARVKRDIYRETGVQWESDSKDAEAEGSLSLKREEMNTRLAQFADECQRADHQLAQIFYGWKHGGKEAGEKQFKADGVTIQYPERFADTPFADVLAQVQAAQAIGMPTEFLKALRKAIVSKFEGMANLPPLELQAILDAIDAAEDDPTPQEKQRQKMEIMSKGFEATGTVPPDAKKDDAA